MSYKIDFFHDKKKLQFSVSFDTYQEINDISGPLFFKKYCKDLTVLKTPVEDYNFTQEMDVSKIKKMPKIPADAKDEEKEKIRAERKAIKQENNLFIENTKDCCSKVKRNFFASAFEQILSDYSKKKGKQKEFGFRSNEKIYTMMNEKNTFSVYFMLNFEEETDQIIAALIFNEFEEVRRHVNDAPMFECFKKKEDLPDSFKMKFPNRIESFGKDTIVLHICLFESHISAERLDATATMLQGFRQYIHYHIHANKTYLHGRIRQKTQKALKQVNLARYEIESIKIFRGRKGKVTANTDMGVDEQDASDIVLRG